MADPDSLAGSAERFDAFVERCLYHPDTGFYTSGAGVAGRRRGDFVTSPEVGPLFADVVGRLIDQVWEDQGRPGELRVVDAGTGPGTLARALAAGAGAGSEAAAQARVVTGFDRATGVGPEAPSDLAGAVVIANEVLDNIPFRIVEHRDGSWHELYVASGPDGTPSEVLVPVPAGGADPHLAGVLAALEGAGVVLGDGVRVPVLEGARRWLEELLGVEPALVVAFDYGALTTAELVTRGGWLRTYRHHQLGTDPLVDPGRCDITVDVALDQLPAPDELTDQARFLRRWGIEELVAEGRAHWQAHAARPDLKAMRMRSRVSEAEALLDPAGLGGWLVATWGRTGAR